MVTPQILAASYLLHMIATVVWIGGIVFMALVLTPAIQDTPESGRVLGAIGRRFGPLAGLSLIVMIVTGMVQLTSSEHYVGFLSIANMWAKAILIKHIAVGGMIATVLYINLVIQPDIRRATMLLSAGKGKPEAVAALTHRRARAAQINLALAMVVLLLTAIARAQ
jgi:putative copper resistance protein D